MQVHENISDFTNNFKICDSEDQEKCNAFTQHLSNSINRIIKSEQFVNCVVEKKVVTTAGGNYLADLYEVDIKGTTESGKKELNLFIKDIKTDLKIGMITPSELNDREIFLYKEYAKLCDKLQQEADVPENERYQFVKCYDIENSEGLIMENMAKKGYTIPDRSKVVSFEYAKLGMINLAKFHALSFAIQKLRPAQYDELCKSKYVLFNFEGDSFTKFLSNSYGACLDVLKSDEAQKKLERVSGGLSEKYQYYLNPENSKICVLAHGDYRLNNILILEREGHILDQVPVDFQCVHYGNPMNDFFYFIVGISDQKFRKKHMNDLKELYYDTLKQFLGYFLISGESVYPRKTFDSDYEERLGFGLIVSILFNPFFLAPEEDFPDLAKDDIGSMTINKSDVFVERMNGLMADFIDWGCL